MVCHRTIPELLFDPAYKVVIDETCTEEPCSPVFRLVHKQTEETVEIYVAAGKLAQRGNGIVRIYAGASTGHQIAVKRIAVDDGESAVLSRIEQSRFACSIVGIRATRCSGCRHAYAVMERMDGSLVDLLATVDARRRMQQSVLDVVDSLTAQLTCLAAEGLLYTDLKFATVLYHRSPTGEYTYRLGDLGSISIDGVCTTTYPLLLPETYEQLQHEDRSLYSLHTSYHCFPSRGTAKSCILYQLARMAAFLYYGIEERVGSACLPTKRRRRVKLSGWNLANCALDAIGVQDPELRVVRTGAPRYSLHSRNNARLHSNIVHNRSGVIDVYRIEDLTLLREWQIVFAARLAQDFPDRKFHLWLAGELHPEAVDKMFTMPAPLLQQWGVWYSTLVASQA
jgi:hypothetical protein